MLYPGDKMLELQSVYYSYFWLFFIPFVRIGWLEPVLFVVHISSIYLTYWAIWELSQTLFNNKLASLFSIVAMVVPHFGFVGFPLFEFAPLSRTFVLPFLLIAINQFFKGRVIVAFFIAGLMYNIHVVSVNFILAMFGLACLLQFSTIGFRKIFPGIAIFIVAALPVLLWKVGGDPVDFSLRPEWVDFLNLTLFRHIFALVGKYPATWVIVLCGISVWILFFIARSKTESPQIAVTASNFIFAGIIVIAVNVITVNWLPVTIIIQSQIARIGLWTLILSYIFFANYLARTYEEKTLSPVAFWLLFTTFVFSPLPILPLITWLLVRYVKSKVVIKTAAVAFPIAIIISCAIFLYLDFWHPGVFIYGEKTPWVDVQEWAQKNTPLDANFITPPEKWGVQESDWRVFSERSSAVSLSELLVAAFQPGYEIGWKPRFELVAPGALEKFNGDYFGNREVTRQAYSSLSTSRLLNAACIFKARYIVTEKPSAHNLPIAYENSSYFIYDVSHIACD